MSLLLNVAVTVETEVSYNSVKFNYEKHVVVLPGIWESILPKWIFHFEP